MLEIERTVAAPVLRLGRPQLAQPARHLFRRHVQIETLLVHVQQHRIAVADRPQWTAYPMLSQKAAVLLRSLVTSYPFVDQNKRIGLLVTGVFVMVLVWLFE